MRQVTETFNVYKFDELEKDVQEKVLDKFRDDEEFPFLEDDMQCELERLLKKYKISYDESPKVYYSLSYCQGDGAMFEGVVYWKSYVATIKQSGHYYHYNSKNFELESVKTGKDASQEAYDEFNKVYVEICKELEKVGYSIIEDIRSEESIKETIEANGYEFLASGRLY